MTTTLEIARPQCAAEVLDGEVVALNVGSGIYVSIRGLGTALWADLAAGHPVETLAACAGAHGGDAQAVADFAARVTEQGLMRPGAAAAPAGEPTLGDRLRGGDREIVYEVFDDMQDLILSDPIHDVDESKGWPHRADPRA